jgi:glycerophosphoryl diester phosphodiesterase
MSAPAWLTARPIAHRGLHDRSRGVVENTLSAAEAAAAGKFAIECDVQDSADGEAVVFHDHTLDRLTDQRGPVRDRTAAELTGLAIAATPDRIPTLQTFLERVNGRVPVIIEIKSRFAGDLRLTNRTVEIASGYRGPVAIKSFDPAVVGALRGIASDLPRGVVAQGRYDEREWQGLSEETRHGMANLLHLPHTQPHFVSWRVGDLPLAAPFLCRHLGGMPVMAWTVRTEDGRQRAAAHADQMVFEGFRPDL